METLGSLLAGMAGVYDIAEHLQYEAGRGVRYLSTMERALGGEGQFPRQSPSVILSCAAGVSAREASPRRALMPGCVAIRVHPRLKHFSVLECLLEQASIGRKALARIAVIAWSRNGKAGPERTAVSVSTYNLTSGLSRYTQHTAVQTRIVL